MTSTLGFKGAFEILENLLMAFGSKIASHIGSEVSVNKVDRVCPYAESSNLSRS